MSLPLFVSSASWKVDLPAAHVAAFSGSESESGGRFGAVARASIGETTVFVLREAGSRGSVDVVFVLPLPLLALKNPRIHNANRATNTRTPP